MAYIMIVDDDADLANTTAKVLETDRHQVSIQLDTHGAGKALEERVPELMILDVMFPEDSSAGFDFARTLRKDERFTTMPILMLTAINEKYPFGFSASDIDEDWLPVTEFMEKPVDFDVLRKKVADMLGG